MFGSSSEDSFGQGLFLSLCVRVSPSSDRVLSLLCGQTSSTRSTSPTCHRFLLPLFPPARTPSPSDHNIGLSPVTDLPSAFRSVCSQDPCTTDRTSSSVQQSDPSVPRCTCRYDWDWRRSYCSMSSDGTRCR
jgi:hypothetical protein